MFKIKELKNTAGASLEHTAWKVSKYRVFSGPHFPIFSPTTGKYGEKKTPYLETFNAVAKYTHNVIKKYVILITSSIFTLCRKCNSNFFQIQAALQKLLK